MVQLSRFNIARQRSKSRESWGNSVVLNITALLRIGELLTVSCGTALSWALKTHEDLMLLLTLIIWMNAKAQRGKENRKLKGI